MPTEVELPWDDLIAAKHRCHMRVFAVVLLLWACLLVECQAVQAQTAQASGVRSGGCPSGTCRTPAVRPRRARRGR